MEQTFPVVLGFDMETDIGSWTGSYDGFRTGAPRLLEILRRKECRATFFFTGDCAARHPDMVRRTRDDGHEIGCHSLYHETIGEPLFEIPGMIPILPHEVRPRIELATEWVEKAAGIRPRSFRCPRLFGSTAVVNALEALEYRTDVSYPVYYFRKQLAPYHPSRENWTETGDLQLLELPNFADLSMPSADPYGRDLDQWPLWRTQGAAALMEHVRAYLDYCRAREVRPFLCFYMHPWEFAEMPQGLIHSGEGAVLPDAFLVKNCGDYAAREFEKVLDALRELGAVFRCAAEIAVTSEETC